MVTTAVAADRLYAHLKRRVRLTPYDIRAVLESLHSYCPRARAGSVQARGRMEWAMVLKRESQDVIDALLSDLWNQIARRLATDPKVRQEQFPVRRVAPRQTESSPARRPLWNPSARYEAEVPRRPLETSPMPSPAHLRAVRRAHDKFFGLNGYPPFEKLQDAPSYRICWDDPELLQRSDANACAIFDVDGTIKLCVRTTADPDDVERSTIHELRHIVDYKPMLDRLRVEMEQRAEVTASMLGPGNSVRRRLEERE